MKTTVLAFVLVTALAAGAQDATPQQTQPAAPPASGQQPAAQRLPDSRPGSPAQPRRRLKIPPNITPISGQFSRKTPTRKSARSRHFSLNIRTA